MKTMDDERITVCAGCEGAGVWVNERVVYRVTGEEGSIPEQILLITCECGHEQEA
tara:strand:+ start:1125 stop:1289 length:165 start_codon:yes stop_codon:yes gene_type:complete